MGAAMLVPLLTSVVSSVLAPPPPQPVVVEPPPIQPSLTGAAAQQIAQTTEEKGSAFGQNMLNSILARAKAQGTGEKEMSDIKNQFNTWFSQNQDEISKSLALQAAHSQAQADYQNAIQNNAFNAKLQALQASTPQGGFNLGGLVGGLGGMFGGGGGSTGFSAPQVYDPGTLASGQNYSA